MKPLGTIPQTLGRLSVADATLIKIQGRTHLDFRRHYPVRDTSIVDRDIRGYMRVTLFLFELGVLDETVS